MEPLSGHVSSSNRSQSRKPFEFLFRPHAVALPAGKPAPPKRSPQIFHKGFFVAFAFQDEVGRRIWQPHEVCVVGLSTNTQPRLTAIVNAQLDGNRLPFALGALVPFLKPRFE